MAYSKVLEELIEAALADGVLTDKERAVLHKRALQEGVDPEELDVVIEGRLAKMKREVDWLRPAPPATEKMGNIVKCPSCGAPVEPGSAKCRECGHVFRNVNTVSSVQRLFEQLTNIEKERTEYNEEKIFNQASSLIKAYPVPTAKEDILEFLTTASTYIYDGRSNKSSVIWIIVCIILIIIGLPLCLAHGVGVFPLGIAGYIIYNKFYKISYEKKMARIWKSKTSQIIAKARYSLNGDPEFARLEAHLSQSFSLDSIVNDKKTLKIAGGIICAIVICILGYVLYSNHKSRAVEPQAKAQYEQLSEKLDALETPDEVNYCSVSLTLI